MNVLVGIVLWLLCGSAGRCLIRAWWDRGWGAGDFDRLYGNRNRALLHVCLGGCTLLAGGALYSFVDAGPGR